jgi:hypothetical protein
MTSKLREAAQALVDDLTPDGFSRSALNDHTKNNPWTKLVNTLRAALAEPEPDRETCDHEFVIYQTAGDGRVKCCKKCDGFLLLKELPNFDGEKIAAQQAEIAALRAENEELRARHEAHECLKIHSVISRESPTSTTAYRFSLQHCDRGVIVVVEDLPKSGRVIWDDGLLSTVKRAEEAEAACRVMARMLGKEATT